MSLFKIEMYKYIHNKSFILYLTVTLISFFIPFFIQKIYAADSFNNAISSYHDILSFNIYLTLPIITILYFTYFISMEYSKNTINLLLTSIYSKEKIVITKFIVASITFAVILTVANLIIITVLYFSFGTLNAGVGNYGNFSLYSFFDAISAISIVNIFLYIYFISWGSLSFLISVIVKNRITAVILTLSLFILVKALPVTNQMINYTFFDGTSNLVGLLDLKNSLYFLSQKGFSSIGFILLFLLISVNFFRKYPHKKGTI